MANIETGEMLNVDKIAEFLKASKSSYAKNYVMFYLVSHFICNQMNSIEGEKYKITLTGSKKQAYYDMFGTYSLINTNMSYIPKNIRIELC